MIPENYKEDLKARLNTRAAEICEHLLKGGKQRGSHYFAGGIEGGPGKSLEVELDGDKIGLWIDRATGEAGDLLKLWQLSRGLSFPQTIEQAAEHLNMAQPKLKERKVSLTKFKWTDIVPDGPTDDDPMPECHAERKSPVIDWLKFVNEFTPAKAKELAEWRGYSPDFVTWLRDNQLVGCFRGNFAFPVLNPKGEVVRIHYRLEKGWAYYPSGGGENSALVIGSLMHATHTLAFESQWDAFAVLDKLGAHLPANLGIYAAYITRGATSNTDISSLLIPNLIALPQNDPPEKASKTTGRTPAEEWLMKIQSSRNKLTQFSVFETPVPHKDANDWIKTDQPDAADVFSGVIQRSKNPLLKDVKTVSQLLKIMADENGKKKDDPNSLIGHGKRYLGKGGSWLFIGPSGIGKSSLTTSLAMHASAGISWHGITFRRPLKVLVIQAENDEGDLAEMLSGVTKSSSFKVEFDAKARETLVKNLSFIHCMDRTGEKFTKWMEEVIHETGAELVLLDPLLSFIGDDISQQKVASRFLRDCLQPVLKRTGAICLLIHHTGKPPKDPKTATKGWTDSDFSYLGLGSSELVNWVRAVAVIMATSQPGTFMFKLTKRGERSGIIDQFSGQRAEGNTVYLRHGSDSEGMQWIQTKYEEPEEDEKPWKGRSKSAKAEEEPIDAGIFIPLLKPVATYQEIFDMLGRQGVKGYKAKKVIADLLLRNAIVKELDGTYSRTVMKK